MAALRDCDGELMPRCDVASAPLKPAGLSGSPKNSAKSEKMPPSRPNLGRPLCAAETGSKYECTRHAPGDA